MLDIDLSRSLRFLKSVGRLNFLFSVLDSPRMK